MKIRKNYTQSSVGGRGKNRCKNVRTRSNLVGGAVRSEAALMILEPGAVGDGG